MSKKTVIIGATTNPTRYAYFAAEMLLNYGHEFVPIGIKKGVVFGQPILNLTNRPEVTGTHTVTLYIGPQHQPEWCDYVLTLRPERVIFNPGTENPEFQRMAEAAGIEVMEACTLVMLRTGQY
jgi:predicted CoA-binding protein